MFAPRADVAQMREVSSKKEKQNNRKREIKEAKAVRLLFLFASFPALNNLLISW